MKELLIVYQDCFMCGSSKAWGEKTIEHITSKGVPYRKVSFASMEGQEHALKAIKAGIKSYPFVTDGEKYAKNVDDLFEIKKADVKITTKAKKAKKSKGK